MEQHELRTRFIELKSELDKVKNELEGVYTKLPNDSMVKINGKFFRLYYQTMNDDGTFKYNFIHTDTKSNYSLSSGTLYLNDETLLTHRVYSSEHIDILNHYINERIHYIEGQDNLTVGQQRAKLEFWEKAKRKLINSCPHKKYQNRRIFSYEVENYCEFCGTEMEE